MIRFRNKPTAARQFTETADIFHEVGEDPTAQRIARLANYNSERQRGLLHTIAWDTFMRQEQAWFDALHGIEGGVFPITLKGTP